MERFIQLANRLEGILRKYLDCDYTEFGVKSNGNLDSGHWKEPINFALGYRYAISRNDSDKKQDIEKFRGNLLEGENINDLIKNHDCYGLSSKDKALDKVEEIIDEFERILLN